MTISSVIRSMTVGCALAASGFAAHASVITLSDSFSNLLTELVGESLRVGLFDSTQGTLNRVVVTMSGDLASQGTVRNTAAQAQNFTVSTRAQLYTGTAAAGSPAALPSLVDIFAPFALIGQQSYVQLAPDVPVPFGPVSASTGIFTVLDTTDAGELAQFLGAGDFGYDVDSLILTAIQGGGGNIVTSIETLAGATLAVEYQFTPRPTQAPVPATLPLVALGLAGLAFTLRRKTSS